MNKLVLAIAALLLAACDSDYHRVVNAAPDKVASALVGLDIREAPGEPGTDPMRSADIPSMFSAAVEGDGVVWTVTNGGEVAVRLLAHLEPVDGGKTKVTLDYERGSAPDDHVAPAFRSRGITMGLLAMMVEERLDKLTMPPKKWTAKCDAIMAEFEGAGDFGAPEPANLKQAIGRTARNGMRLSALDKELKAAGCPTGFPGEFKPVKSEMDESPPMPAPPPATADATRPMVDLSPR